MQFKRRLVGCQVSLDVENDSAGQRHLEKKKSCFKCIIYKSNKKDWYVRFKTVPKSFVQTETETPVGHLIVV